MFLKKTLMAGIGVLAFGTLAMSNAAHAVPTTFFGENLTPGGAVVGAPVTARNNFLAGLSGGVGTEDFEGIAVGTSAPIALTFPGSTGNITATLTNGGPADINGAPSVGRFATSGTNYVETNAGAAFNIAFSAPIAAFGFFATDIGDFGGQISMSLTPSGGGANVDITVPNTVNAPDAALLFFGFIDTDQTYTNILFSNSSGTDVFGFDDMTVGDAEQVTLDQVPEPGSMALLVFGLAGAYALRRRKLATA